MKLASSHTTTTANATSSKSLRFSGRSPTVSRLPFKRLQGGRSLGSAEGARPPAGRLLPGPGSAPAPSVGSLPWGLPGNVPPTPWFGHAGQCSCACVLQHPRSPEAGRGLGEGQEGGVVAKGAKGKGLGPGLGGAEGAVGAEGAKGGAWASEAGRGRRGQRAVRGCQPWPVAWGAALESRLAPADA